MLIPGIAHPDLLLIDVILSWFLRFHLTNIETPLVQILQPLVVQGEPLDDVFPQALGGPDAELRSHGALHAVADRDDHIQVVEIKMPLNVSCVNQTVSFSSRTSMRVRPSSV